LVALSLPLLFDASLLTRILLIFFVLLLNTAIIFLIPFRLLMVALIAKFFFIIVLLFVFIFLNSLDLMMPVHCDVRLGPVVLLRVALGGMMLAALAALIVYVTR
jgi:hypothetical protein